MRIHAFNRRFGVLVLVLICWTSLIRSAVGQSFYYSNCPQIEWELKNVDGRIREHQAKGWPNLDTIWARYGNRYGNREVSAKVNREYRRLRDEYVRALTQLESERDALKTRLDTCLEQERKAKAAQREREQEYRRLDQERARLAAERQRQNEETFARLREDSERRNRETQELLNQSTQNLLKSIQDLSARRAAESRAAAQAAAETADTLRDAGNILEQADDFLRERVTPSGDQGVVEAIEEMPSFLSELGGLFGSGASLAGSAATALDVGALTAKVVGREDGADGSDVTRDDLSLMLGLLPNAPGVAARSSARVNEYMRDDVMGLLLGDGDGSGKTWLLPENLVGELARGNTTWDPFAPGGKVDDFRRKTDAAASEATTGVSIPLSQGQTGGGGGDDGTPADRPALPSPPRKRAPLPAWSPRSPEPGPQVSATKPFTEWAQRAAPNATQFRVHTDGLQAYNGREWVEVPHVPAGLQYPAADSGTVIWNGTSWVNERGETLSWEPPGQNSPNAPGAAHADPLRGLLGF